MSRNIFDDINDINKALTEVAEKINPTFGMLCFSYLKSYRNEFIPRLFAVSGRESMKDRKVTPELIISVYKANKWLYDFNNVWSKRIGELSVLLDTQFDVHIEKSNDAYTAWLTYRPSLYDVKITEEAYKDALNSQASPYEDAPKASKILNSIAEICNAFFKQTAGNPMAMPYFSEYKKLQDILRIIDDRNE